MSVHFQNFALLDPAAKHLASDLLEHAQRARSAFVSFASVWFAFNGWMESVTDATRDFEMINAIVADERLNHAFEELMKDKSFARDVTEFSLLWPVYNVRDIRKKLGRDCLWNFHFPDLVARCQQERVKHQPFEWAVGRTPTWEDLLRTIYLVRCNMFHGAKSPFNARDHSLIDNSKTVLSTFIAKTRCFEWH